MSKTTELADMPGWFDDTDNVKFIPGFPSEAEVWWEKNVHNHSGITPVGFATILLRDMPGQCMVTYLSFSDADENGEHVQGQPQNGGGISLQMVGMDGPAIMHFSGTTLSISGPLRIVEPDLVNVPPDYQRIGIGTILITNIYAAAEAVGADKFVVKAGLEDGPYAWIKYGVFPTDTEWERITPKIREKLDALGAMVNPDDQARVNEALRTTSGAAITRIAVMESLVLSRPAQGASREVPLGYALLADSGIKWYGELNLHDNDATRLMESRLKQRDRGYKP